MQDFVCNICVQLLFSISYKIAHIDRRINIIIDLKLVSEWNGGNAKLIKIRDKMAQILIPPCHKQLSQQ